MPILLRVEPAERAGIEQNSDIIGRLAKVSAIEFVESMPEGTGVRSAPGFDVAVVYERTIDVAVECERLTKELARLRRKQPMPIASWRTRVSWPRLPRAW